MARSKKFPVWLSDFEYRKLQEEAARKGIAMAEVVRALIEQLPEPVAISDVETFILSQSSLEKDWLSPEEDEAWQDL